MSDQRKICFKLIEIYRAIFKEILKNLLLHYRFVLLNRMLNIDILNNYNRITKYGQTRRYAEIQNGAFDGHLIREIIRGIE